MLAHPPVSLGNIVVPGSVFQHGQLHASLHCSIMASESANAYLAILAREFPGLFPTASAPPPVSCAGHPPAPDTSVPSALNSSAPAGDRRWPQGREQDIIPLLGTLPPQTRHHGGYIKRSETSSRGGRWRMWGSDALICDACRTRTFALWIWTSSSPAMLFYAPSRLRVTWTRTRMT